MKNLKREALLTFSSLHSWLIAAWSVGVGFGKLQTLADTTTPHIGRNQTSTSVEAYWDLQSARPTYATCCCYSPRLQTKLSEYDMKWCIMWPKWCCKHCLNYVNSASATIRPLSWLWPKLVFCFASRQTMTVVQMDDAGWWRASTCTMIQQAFPASSFLKNWYRTARIRLISHSVTQTCKMAAVSQPLEWSFITSLPVKTEGMKTATNNSFHTGE